MAAVKRYNPTTGNWEYIVLGKQGPPGPAGPKGTPGPNVVTSSTLSDGTASLAVQAISAIDFSFGEDSTFIYDNAAAITNHLIALGAGDFGRTLFSTTTPESALTSLGAWLKDGNNLHYISGNIGIGTSSPTERLNVSGNILATGTIAGSNLSGNNTGDQDLSGLVPYTGATSDVNLGTRNIQLGGITASGAISASSLSLTTALPISSGGTGATNETNARSNLGLGSFAVLNNNGTASLSVSQISSPAYVFGNSCTFTYGTGALTAHQTALGMSTFGVSLVGAAAASNARTILEINATNTPYDNSLVLNGNQIDATDVQGALDQLAVTKVNIKDLGTNVTLFPTTVESDVVGYYKMVTTTADPDYNTSAVDFTTPPVTFDEIELGALVSPPDLIKGSPGLINITTIGNIAKVSGNRDAVFYFKLYKRSALGVEELLCESDPTPAVSSAEYRQFSESALLPLSATFVDTDRIVLRYFGRKVLDTGENPIYKFQFGGTDPVRTLLPVPASVSIQETWRKNGSDIFFNDGNVGIGTTEPTEKLSVVGNTQSSAYQFSGTDNQIIEVNNRPGAWRSTGKNVLTTSIGGDSAPSSLFFSSDGTKMYCGGRTNDTIRQYTLSIPWDITTTVTPDFALSTTSGLPGGVSGETEPRNIFFRSDGLVMFLVGTNQNRIRKYVLSTPWDLSTAAYDSQSPSIASAPYSINPSGLWFSPDGLVCFVAGASTVRRIGLTVAWDVTNINLLDSLLVGNSTYPNVPTSEYVVRSVILSEDGLNLYILGEEKDFVICYRLSTPWSFDVAPSVRDVSPTFGEATPTALFIKEGLGRAWIVGDTSDFIRELNTKATNTHVALDGQNVTVSRLRVLAINGLHITQNSPWGTYRAFEEVNSGGVNHTTVRSAYGVTIQTGGPQHSTAVTLDAETGVIVYSTNSSLGWASGGTTWGFRSPAAHIIEQRSRNTVSPSQTYRLYNTYTSTTNFERLNFRFASGNAIIGTEKGSAGGLARSLSFETDGTTRMTIASGGDINVVGSLSAASVVSRLISNDNVIEISTATVNLTYADHAGMYIRLTHADGPILIVLDFDDTIPKGAEYFFFKATDQPITFTGATVNGESRISDVDQNSGFALKRVVTGGAFDLI
jgi:hypothetical protein